ncbi:MAG TPA: hypothetical protein PKI78_06980 [Anaerolineales bacterium]|nr:hypothetical protein [Anaerolineales bacterium]
MNNIQMNFPTSETNSASLSDLQTAPRLIVLVPEFETDAAIVARKIREVAKNLETRVQLIGLSKDAAHEPGVRRRLVTLSALVEDHALFVEARVEIGSSWLNAISPHWRPGDVLVCFSEQHADAGFQPMHQILKSNLNAPVYVLSGIQLQIDSTRPAWLNSILAWGGSIGLIVAFFWLQSKLMQPAQSGLATVLLYGSLIAEAGSIWFWNDLFK